jgi:hypothetical protein
MLYVNSKRNCRCVFSSLSLCHMMLRVFLQGEAWRFDSVCPVEWYLLVELNLCMCVYRFMDLLTCCPSLYAVCKHQQKLSLYFFLLALPCDGTSALETFDCFFGLSSVQESDSAMGLLPACSENLHASADLIWNQRKQTGPAVLQAWQQICLFMYVQHDRIWLNIFSLVRSVIEPRVSRFIISSYTDVI